MAKNTFQVGISAERMTEAQKRLAGLGGDIEEIVAKSQTYARDYAKKRVNEFIMEKYAISEEAINAVSVIKSRAFKTAGVGRWANFTLSSNKIDLYKYDGTSPLVRTNGRRKHLVEMTRGANYVFESAIASGRQFRDTSPSPIKAEGNRSDAFIATVAAGTHGATHTGIFQRVKGSQRKGFPNIEQIREVEGSSPSQMLGNDEVGESLREATQAVLDKKFDSEVEKVMKGSM